MMVPLVFRAYFQLTPAIRALYWILLNSIRVNRQRIFIGCDRW